MSDQAQQTPLVDLLRNIPRDFRAQWAIQWREDGSPTGHALSPVGRLMHEAADEIDRLTAAVDSMPTITDNSKVNAELIEQNRALQARVAMLEDFTAGAHVDALRALDPDYVPKEVESAMVSLLERCKTITREDDPDDIEPRVRQAGRGERRRGADPESD